MRFLLLFLIPVFAFGHVTETEMKIVDNMRKANAEAAVLAKENADIAASATKRTLKAIEGLDGVAALATQTGRAMDLFEDQTRVIAKIAAEWQNKAQETKTELATQKTRTLQWASAAVLTWVLTGFYLIYKLR